MRKRLWAALAGLAVIGVGAYAAGALFGSSEIVWTLPVHRVGAGPWRRVFTDAMSMQRASRYYVFDGQIVFGPHGHLRASSWSLDAPLRSGQSAVIQVDTAGLGPVITWNESATSMPLQLGPTPSQLTALLRSGALLRWSRAHPANRYVLQISSAIVPEGSPVLTLVHGAFLPGRAEALPYTVSLEALRRASVSHTRTGSTVTYNGVAYAYLQL